MDQKVKADWVAALRSGDYRQGNGALRWQSPIEKLDHFCCLGVLCDLAEKSEVVGSPIVNVTRYFYGETAEDGHLPDEVVIWAGLSAEDPDIDYHFVNDHDEPATYNTLSEANDNGLTFAEIADIIEEQL